MQERDQLANDVIRALMTYRSESDELEFKRELDTRDEISFLGFVKDVAAMANSDGGHILVGVVCKKDQPFSVPGVDDSTFFDDATSLSQRVNSYYSCEVSITMRDVPVEWNDSPAHVWAIYVRRASSPVMFIKTGQTSTPPRRPVFYKHDIPIRHHAASVTAASYQVEALLRSRGVQRVREELVELLGYDPQTRPPTRNTSRPILHNLPETTYTTFVGRDDDFLTLRDFFNNPNQRLLTIDGIGGVGKTALAREFAARLLTAQIQVNQPPELILWLSAKSKELTSLGPRALPPDAVDDVYLPVCLIVAGADVEAVENPRREALAILAESSSLIILDNLESLEDPAIEALTAAVVRDLPAYTTKVVFTTRHVAIREGASLRLDRLSMRDAALLVEHELANRSLSLSEDEKERLISKTGRIPLAIKYVIGRFQWVHDIPQTIQLADQDEALLEFIFRETFGILNTEERLVLFAASLEEAVTLRMLQAATGLSSPALDRSLVKLKGVSFVDYDGRSGAYLLSPLTKSFARSELSKDVELNLRLQERLKRHKDILRLVKSEEALSADMQDALLLCRHATALIGRGDSAQGDEEFARAERDFPEARGYVLMARGDACFDAGRYREALNAYLRAEGSGVPIQPRVSYRVAWLLMNVDRPNAERAFGYCKKAVEVESENPVFCKLYGELSVALELEGAEGILARGLYADPRGPMQRNHNLAVWLALAELALSEKRTRDVDRYLESVDQVDPTNRRARELRGKWTDPEIMRGIAADVRRRGKGRRR